MNVLLIFDGNLPIDKQRLLRFLNQKVNHIRFELYTGPFALKCNLITKPETFPAIRAQFKSTGKSYDKIFCFTEKQYADNYFFHEESGLVVFSFYGWSYLTDLPISNGVIYFIVDYLVLSFDQSRFRHNNITGCIYDFLYDKTGIDDGMRQARLCSKCLNRLSKSLTDENDLKIFEDVKVLLNHLSDASRWNKDVLSSVRESPKTIPKRKPKKGDVVSVVIASPGDTESERKVLLESLEVRFRRDNHEKHCCFRVIVSGWEDLASQNGYAQDVINEKIIQESDFVVAVFKHKLGTPTKHVDTGRKRAESGTAEELLQALDKIEPSHPIGMAYFYSKAPVISLDSPDKGKIEKDWVRLAKFKDSIRDKMIYKPYTDTTELLTMVLKDLEKNIIDYIGK